MRCAHAISMNRFQSCLLPGAERVGIFQRPSIQVDAADRNARLAAEIERAIEISRFTFSVDHRHEGRESDIGAVRVRPRDEHHLGTASVERTDDRAFIAQITRRSQVDVQGPSHFFPNGDNGL